MTRIQRPGTTTPTPAPTRAKPPKRTHGTVKSGNKGQHASSGKSKKTKPAPVDSNYDRTAITNTGQVYDPAAAYGRTLAQPGAPTWKQFLHNQGVQAHGLGQHREHNLQKTWKAQGGGAPPWDATEAGRNAATNNPDGYTSYLMGEAGGLGAVPAYGGPTTFGQWLAGDHQDQLMRGYQAANFASGGNLGFSDYMTSAGWGAGSHNDFNAPLDTGNAFTSSSFPTAGAPAAPQSFQNYLGGRGMNQHQFQNLGQHRKHNIRNAFGAQVPAPTAPAVSPQSGGGGLNGARLSYLSMTPQQRGINSATGQKPTRWATF